MKKEAAMITAAIVALLEAIAAFGVLPAVTPEQEGAIEVAVKSLMLALPLLGGVFIRQQVYSRETVSRLKRQLKKAKAEIAKTEDEQRIEGIVTDVLRKAGVSDDD